MVVPPYFEVPPRAYGGVESVVADLTDALVARGHEVTLLGAGTGHTAGRFIPVWPEPIPHRLGEPFPEVVHAAMARRAVARLATERGLDLVHDHTLAGPLNAPTYAGLRLPTVVTAHGPVDEDLRQLYRTLGNDIHLVAISERQRTIAPELHWAGRVHNGIRVGTFPFQPVKGRYALFLGRFCPDKAPHLALEAAHEAGVPLVLAGKCAEPLEKAYFNDQIKPRLTASDEVFGVADSKAKRRLLAGARCLLFPVQWEEPFGMVMIEAMACGTPVIAIGRGAVPEVVVDGVTGYICREPAELPEAIRRAGLIDPAACRAHAEAGFDIERLGLGYEEVYRTVLAAHRIGSVDPSGRVLRDRRELDTALDRRYVRDNWRARRPGAWPGRGPTTEQIRKAGTT